MEVKTLRPLYEIYLSRKWCKNEKAHLSDILVSISEAEQEVRQHMDHVWLKQLPQHVTQHLKGKQCSCKRQVQ